MQPNKSPETVTFGYSSTGSYLIRVETVEVRIMPRSQYFNVLTEEPPPNQPENK